MDVEDPTGLHECAVSTPPTDSSPQSWDLGFLTAPRFLPSPSAAVPEYALI